MLTRGCGRSGSQTLSLIIIIIIKSAFCYILRYPFLGGCQGCVRGLPHSLPLAHTASSPKSCLRNASPSPEKGTNGAEFALNPAREQPLKAKQRGAILLSLFPCLPISVRTETWGLSGSETAPQLLGSSSGRSFPAQQRRGGNTQRLGSLCCASKIPLQAPCSRRRGASAEPARSCGLSGRAAARLPSFFFLVIFLFLCDFSLFFGSWGMLRGE